nr:hypothetical protein [Tanacetum cinerariifolium]
MGMQARGEKPKFEGKKLEFEVHVSQSSNAQTKKHDDKTKREAKDKSPVESLTRYRNLSVEFEDLSNNSINKVNAADSPVPAVGQISTDSTNTFSAVGPSNATVSSTHKKSSYVNTSQYTDDLNMPELEDITYSDDEEDVSTEANFTNLETTITVIPIPTTRVHKDHYVTQIIGDLSLATQTRSMTREELLQFKIQKVWVLVDLPHEKRAIGTKWGFRNKKDERGIVVRNKARLVTQGHTQEDDIDYEEVFAPVARIEAIRMLKVLSCMELLRKRGKIDQTLFIKRQKGNILLVQIYVDDIIFGSTNKDLCKAFEKLMKDKFQMSSMGELTFFLGLQVKQNQDGIFISQDKYVAKILRKFGLTDGKSASTPIYTKKPLLKVPDGEDVDVHTYRSMIGSLMYLTTSSPDIMFAGRIIASMDADVDVTLKDVADIAKEVAVDAEIEETELQEVVEVVTTAKLMTEVVTAASATITAADTLIHAATITTAAPTLTTVPSAARRRKGVVIRDPEKTATPSTIIHSDSKSKDKGKGILMINSNVAFLEKTREQMEKEDIKALKRTSESRAKKEAKKHKLDEEVEELKRHLQIVSNDEDDLYTEATPLARKVPVVDYEIYTENNKPYYKIIRADGSP